MGAAGRQLFVYWRCAVAERAAALAAAQALQGRLRASLPALQAGLFVRSEADAAGTATLMETYAQPGGIDEATRQRIEAEAAPALQAWCRGARHVEVFEPVGG